MKFIIPLNPTNSENEDSSKTIFTNRLNNGYAPIIGPVDPEKVQEAVNELREKSGNQNVKYLVIDGVLM